MKYIDEKDGVILTDEEGLEHQFIIIDMVEIESLGIYAILMPMELEDKNKDNYIIMKIVKEDDKELLMTIDDDYEYENVAKIIEDLYCEEDDDQEIVNSI